LNSEWETRNAAGKALEAIATNISEWNPVIPEEENIGILYK
jgi:hypothetical protein